MRTTKLGDLTVSAQGLGCMGMSEWYGPTDWDESIATINRALDLGVTFIDLTPGELAVLDPLATCVTGTRY